MHAQQRTTQRNTEGTSAASSIQFQLDMDAQALQVFLAACGARGLHIKWFGVEEPLGFTSNFEHWRYLGPSSLPHTRTMLRGLCDVRIPLSLTTEECVVIGRIARLAMAAATQ